MTRKLKTVKLGLPKPNLGDPDKILFYASMDNNSIAEVGGEPLYVESETAPIVPSAYGLQSKGAFKYALNGLDVTKPFTVSYTLERFSNSYANAWSIVFGIFLLGCDTVTSQGGYKPLLRLNTRDGENLASYPYACVANMEDSEKSKIIEYEVLKSYILSGKPLRFTHIYDGESFLSYIGNKLVGKTQINIDLGFKGKPNMQINLNIGHNSIPLRFGLSEILVSQSVVLPLGEEDYTDPNNIYLPKIPRYKRLSNLELNVNMSAYLPCEYYNTPNYDFNGEYTRDLNRNVTAKNNYYVCIMGRSHPAMWTVGDTIAIKGHLGEIVQATPVVKYINAQEVVTNVVGSWSGLGTSRATFTIGDNGGNLVAQGITVEFNLLVPRKSSSPTLPFVPERIANVKYRGENYRLTGGVQSALGVNCNVFTARGSANSLLVNKETLSVFNLDRITEGEDSNLELLVEQDDYNQVSGSLTALRGYKCIATTQSYSKAKTYFNPNLHRLTNLELLTQLGDDTISINGVNSYILNLNSLGINTDYVDIISNFYNYGKVSESNISNLGAIRYTLAVRKTGEICIYINSKILLDTNVVNVSGRTLKDLDTKIATGYFIKK